MIYIYIYILIFLILAHQNHQKINFKKLINIFKIKNNFKNKLN